MPAGRVVFEVLRSASRDAFQVAFSFAARPPVSTMIKPVIAKSLLHQDQKNISKEPCLVSKPYFTKTKLSAVQGLHGQYY
ncbi:hypothetical protein EJB05_10572 [Eragrostis curvula]|uniref:Uncharacterized protein n=1 Tax=Eragrostis curvula TaxID=38414 RepID=A0A5J9VP33_9POAL|nr:hypothetical protein EJB05_10572 [Eragrostis curvula]